MAKKKRNIVEKESVVVKFVGDLGDGMQLSGDIFSEVAALAGNDLATFPDFPAEIRARRTPLPEFQGSRCTWAVQRSTQPETLWMCLLQ